MIHRLLTVRCTYKFQNHPWTTKNGTDELLSAEENCADLIEPPTEAEMDHAITGNMAHLLAVMKAVKRFKKIVSDKHGQMMEGIFGRDSRLVNPPHSMRHQSKSQDTHNRRPLDKILVTSGFHKDVEVNDNLEKVPTDMDRLSLFQSPEADDEMEVERAIGESDAHYKQRLETLRHRPDVKKDPLQDRTLANRRSRTFPVDGHAKGHAHDPLEDTLFLDIGHDPDLPDGNGGDPERPIVSESPSAVDMNIYEQAYQEEMEKILARRPREPSIYMTRRVEHRDDIRSLSNIKDAGKWAAAHAAAKFDRLSKRGHNFGRGVGDSSKSAANATTEKATKSWLSGSAYAGEYFEAGKQAAKSRGAYASEYLEPWKQYAKSTASTGFDNSKSAAKSAQEKLGALYNRSGGTGEGWSSLVGRAQGKSRTDAAEAPPKDSEQPPSESQDIQAQPTDGTTETSAPTTQTQDTPQPAMGGDTDDQKDQAPAVPGGFPTTSKFTENLS